MFLPDRASDRPRGIALTDAILFHCFTLPSVKIYLLDLQAEQASERATFPGLELQHTREVRYEAFFCRGDSQNFLNIRSW